MCVCVCVRARARVRVVVVVVVGGDYPRVKARTGTRARPMRPLALDATPRGVRPAAASADGFVAVAAGASAVVARRESGAGVGTQAWHGALGQAMPPRGGAASALQVIAHTSGPTSGKGRGNTVGGIGSDESTDVGSDDLERGSNGNEGGAVHTYAYVACLRACAHARWRTRACARARLHACLCTCASVRGRVCAPIHALTQPRTHTYTCARTHLRAQVPSTAGCLAATAVTAHVRELVAAAGRGRQR